MSEYLFFYPIPSEWRDPPYVSLHTRFCVCIWCRSFSLEALEEMPMAIFFLTSAATRKNHAYKLQPADFDHFFSIDKKNHKKGASYTVNPRDYMVYFAFSLPKGASGHYSFNII